MGVAVRTGAVATAGSGTRQPLEARLIQDAISPQNPRDCGVTSTSKTDCKLLASGIELKKVKLSSLVEIHRSSHRKLCRFFLISELRPELLIGLL